MGNVISALFRPIGIFSLAFFRVAFGAMSLWKVIDYLAQGRVQRYWIEPSFNFTYSWFPWVEPLPNEGMVYLFYFLGLLSFLVMVGLFYRPAVLLLGLGFGYVFLLEETLYLNHDYLVILLCFLLFAIPSNKYFAADALIFKHRSDVLPAWCLWLLRFQIGVPYFFGGIAKLNTDWLQGEPMRLWLSRRTSFPLIGDVFTQEWLVYLAAYSGLLLDLLAVPLLLWSRTRPYIFAALILFHFTNARWFTIGIFPWLMIAATTLFFPPDWPKLLWRSIKRQSLRIGLPSLISGAMFAVAGAWFYERAELPVMAVGFVAGVLLVSTLLEPAAYKSEPNKDAAPPTRNNMIVVGLLTTWVAVQALLPLRHFVIPGNPSWTEEGHRFAWHMLLRTKQSTLSYLVTDPATGQRLELDPADILPAWQVSRLSGNPHLIHEFARYVARKFTEDGFEGVEVRAIAESSLNGREPQFLVSPTVNLAAEPSEGWHAEWIEPLEQPLGSRRSSELSPPRKEQSD